MNDHGDVSLRRALEQGLLWRFDDVDFVQKVLAIPAQQRSKEDQERLGRLAVQAQQSQQRVGTVLAAYLDELHNVCRALPLDVLNVEERSMSLEQVYIELQTPDPRMSDIFQPDVVQEQTMTVLERVGYLPDLVILGAPGSGKSTFVKHLALQLAEVFLGSNSTLREYGWPYSRPHLPIRVELRCFAEWLQAPAQAKVTESQALWAYLEHLYTEQQLPQPSEIRGLLKQMFVE